MLLEGIVLAACLNKKGCSEAENAYYNQSLDLQVINHNLEHMGRNLIEGNEWVLYVLSPLSPGYTLAQHKTVKIKLGNVFYVSFNANGTKGGGLEWHF